MLIDAIAMTRIRIEPAITGQGIKAIRNRMMAIWQLRPEIGEAIERAQQALYVNGTIDARLRELIRLRIAFHNQCRTCMAVRYEPEVVTEDMVCSLQHPEEAPDLKPSERVALRYADLFATNHFLINDAIYDELRQHFTEGELVEIGALCAIFVGTGRLAASWDVIEDLPSSFQDAGGGPVTPWGHDAVLALHRRAQTK
jgi:alkylhydroperoxidase family enzyme